MHRLWPHEQAHSRHYGSAQENNEDVGQIAMQVAAMKPLLVMRLLPQSKGTRVQAVEKTKEEQAEK